jgi:hypothetical protein
MGKIILEGNKIIFKGKNGEGYFVFGRTARLLHFSPVLFCSFACFTNCRSWRIAPTTAQYDVESSVLTLSLLMTSRKCCFDANKKKTKLGRRGWKMYYLTLRDLVLYCFKVYRYLWFPPYSNLHRLRFSPGLTEEQIFWYFPQLQGLLDESSSALFLLF